MSTRRFETDLFVLNGASILFHGSALLTLLFSSFFSEIDDAISMAAASTILGILVDLGRMGISKSLGTICKIQSEKYESLQEEYDALQRNYEDNQSASADLEWLRASFPSVDTQLRERDNEKRLYMYYYKKPKDIRTSQSYEDEIRELKNEISELKQQFYPPKVTEKYI